MTITFSHVATYDSGLSPQFITSGDLNSDGVLDLVVAARDQAAVVVFLGTGSGTFQLPTGYSTGQTLRMVKLADFNSDGKLDIAVTSQNSQYVSVLLGNGNGTFGAATNFAAGSGPYGLTVGEFNNDNISDLAITNVGSNNVSVLLGNGNGTFSSAWNVAVGTSPSDVATADFNGDGKFDLAVANSGSANVSVLFGNGDGTFGARTDFAAGTSPFRIITADVNGDGKADLVTANTGSADVSVLLGNGEGNFGQATNFTSGQDTFAVQAADFDNDGKLDLAVVNYTNHNVSVLRGFGNGTFGAPLTFGTGAGPQSLTIGDFNSDGKQDIATSNLFLNNISVLLNTTTPNQHPVITTNGGGSAANVSVAENTTAVTTVAATDPDTGQTLTYSLAGGADASKFSINATTGALAFVTAPDFESPADDGPNNVYDVTVEVSDGNGGTDTQAIAVTVTDENEAPTITSNDGELAVIYPFDETGGSIAHDQQGEHDGTIFGATHVPGVTGNALQFNGSSDYVSVPDSPEWNLGSGEFTIEFWANFNSVPGGGLNGDVPIGQDEGGGTTNKWLLNFSGSSIDFHFVNPSLGGSASVSVPFEPTPGQWYAFALTKSGSSYQFYVDGQLIGSANETLAIPDVAAPLTIGQAEGAFYFDGQLDGVAIHHRALSPAEVQQGYQDGAAAPDAISATISIPENTTAVTTVVATDPDAGQTLSYSIAGGADAELFTIDAQTGALAFVTAPDFEAPADDGTNNVYDVTVEVSDSNGGLDTQAIAVSVTDENENAAPTITSNGGVDTAAVSISESATAVTTVEATDPDTAPASLSYTIVGGADALKFTINSTTGALAFENAPDFEVKADAGADNVYDVTVQVSDGNGGTDTQAIAVTVTNEIGVSRTSNDRTINGTNEEDSLTGLGGANTLQGLGGNDTLLGGGGNDTLLGETGNDVLNGGAGNDRLDGGTGNDAMTGGTDNDTYVVDSLGDTVTEAANQGTDTIQTTLNSFSLGSVANLENLAFTGDGDFVGTGNALSNKITGGNGNDRFVATIGDGDDTYTGGNGVDTIDLSGTTAAATVTGGNATSAQIGNDTLGSIENVIGSQGNDHITGTGAANVIDGGNGNDTLNAGGGEDRIIGGAGNDTMDGGGASDRFVFAAGFGNDSITAFDADPKGGQDLLDISAFGIAGGDFATRVTIADVGADTLVTIDGDPGQTIRLVGIGNATTVTQTDFLL